MKIIQIPVLFDNYAYVVICQNKGQVALIDTPDADAIISYLRKESLTPNMILNTHHHWDHAGGNQEIFNLYQPSVYCSVYDKKRIDCVSQTLKEGDQVLVGDLAFDVLDIPGHTLGHIAYYGQGVLFCGDTLFVGGCGRLFEGSPEQMWQSLNKIKKLPDQTKIYCAHEYTQKNLEFALTLEPQNLKLQEKYREVKEKREQNFSTVPSTIADEKNYNPFLRWDSDEIISNLEKKGYKLLNSPVDVFAAVRELKDSF